MATKAILSSARGVPKKDLFAIGDAFVFVHHFVALAWPVAPQFRAEFRESIHAQNVRRCATAMGAHPQSTQNQRTALNLRYVSAHTSLRVVRIAREFRRSIAQQIHIVIRS